MRRLLSPIRTLTLLSLTTVFHSVPALGQSPSNAPVLLPGPYEAKLNRLVAEHDTAGLNQAILVDVRDADTGGRALNWLKDREISKGGGTQVAMLYSITLWRVAGGSPEPYKTGLRESAATQLFLARMMLVSEGFQCADATAPKSRYSVIEGQLGAINQYLQSRSDADKKPMQDLAFKLLLATFKTRENDIWLCQGGIAQYGKYFDKHPEIGQKPVDQIPGTTVPGVPGKTIMLNDPSILPDFVPYVDWKSKRHSSIDTTADFLHLQHPADYGDGSYRVK